MYEINNAFHHCVVLSPVSGSNGYSGSEKGALEDIFEANTVDLKWETKFHLQSQVLNKLKQHMTADTKDVYFFLYKAESSCLLNPDLLLNPVTSGWTQSICFPYIQCRVVIQVSLIYWVMHQEQIEILSF